MRVCFFRHGPAVPQGTEGVAEDDRPLTEDGRVRTRQAAEGINRLKLGIDEIWTSPLPRALETAEILARALGRPSPRRSDLLRYDVPVRRLLGLLSKVRGSCPVFVGHEPNLGAAVAQLVGARTDSIPMKKAGLAVVDLERPRSGALRLLLAPSVLRLLGR